MTLFGDLSIDDMLKLYSTLGGANTPSNENKALFEELEKSIHDIDPDFELKDQLTPYEAFCLVTKNEHANVLTAVEGYMDTEYTPWDPVVPIDDTQQYPDDDCIPRSNFLHKGFTLDQIQPREDVQSEDAYRFQGNDIEGLTEGDFTPYDEHAIIVDTDQMPDENNVSTKR